MVGLVPAERLDIARRGVDNGSDASQRSLRRLRHSATWRRRPRVRAALKSRHSVSSLLPRIANLVQNGRRLSSDPQPFSAATVAALSVRQLSKLAHVEDKWLHLRKGLYRTDTKQRDHVVACLDFSLQSAVEVQRGAFDKDRAPIILGPADIGEALRGLGGQRTASGCVVLSEHTDAEPRQRPQDWPGAR
jgi:hypothetical protein